MVRQAKLRDSVWIACVSGRQRPIQGSTFVVMLAGRFLDSLFCAFCISVCTILHYSLLPLRYCTMWGFC